MNQPTVPNLFILSVKSKLFVLIQTERYCLRSFSKIMHITRRYFLDDYWNKYTASLGKAVSFISVIFYPTPLFQTT